MIFIFIFIFYVHGATKLLTVSFEELAPVIPVSRVKTSLTIYAADKVSLGSGARHRQTRRPSIVIDAYFPNDGVNSVTVSDGVTQCLQNHRCDALAPSIAICIGVPHLTFARRGQHADIARRYVGQGNKSQICTGGDSNFGSATSDGLHGFMHSHQTGRACRVNCLQNKQKDD